MNGRRGYQSYVENQINTIDRGRLLLMIFDGGLNFMKLAKTSLEANDIPKFARFISKSQAIIVELMSSLDHEACPSVARDLDRLYDFMLYYLTEANIHKDPVRIGRTIEIFNTVASAFREIIDGGAKDSLTTEGDSAVRLGRAVEEAAAGLSVSL